MAERRMFAKTIIDSDAFLDMPPTTQLLYFHLAMRADDDGFVNKPKSVMRMIGATQGDAELLVNKKFIIPFESGIVVIKHWKIHNYIRKDMYHETKYKDEKSLLMLDENSAYTKNVTNQLQERNEPVTNPSTQDRLGKDRLGKDSIDTLSEGREETKQERTDYNGIVNAYNELCPSLPKVKTLSDSRKRAIKSIVKKYGVEQIKEAFKMVEQSDFLTGKKDSSSWNANFDWIMKDSNMAKILDGNYKQQEKKPDNPWMNDERLKGLFK